MYRFGGGGAEAEARRRRFRLLCEGVCVGGQPEELLRLATQSRLHTRLRRRRQAAPLRRLPLLSLPSPLIIEVLLWAAVFCNVGQKHLPVSNIS